MYQISFESCNDCDTFYKSVLPILFLRFEGILQGMMDFVDDSGKVPEVFQDYIPFAIRLHGVGWQGPFDLNWGVLPITTVKQLKQKSFYGHDIGPEDYCRAFFINEELLDSTKMKDLGKLQTIHQIFKMQQYPQKRFLIVKKSRR